VPWVPLDTFYTDDPKVQRAGEATPFAMSVFPRLLTLAKLRADGGRAEITYRQLGFELFISQEEAAKAVAALAMANVITIESQDDSSARVAFSRATWRRWNESFRKQRQREAEAA
jgi:hypothetical protein